MAPLQLPDETQAEGVISADSAQVEIAPAPVNLVRQKEQAEREKRLHRFNWLTLYIPVFLLALFAGVLLGLLGWATLGQGGEVEIGQASGVADFFITLVCLLPLVIVGAILPIAGIGALYWRYTKGSVVRKPLTNLIRRGESGLATAETKLNEQQPRIVDGTIKVRQRIDQIIDLIYSSVTNALAWIDSKLRPNSAE